ncbi:MAG TPA: hypothetical protein VF097_11475, partial [Actinomycetota bacterium]
MGITPVRSEAVWGHLRVLFTGAALLFLINIWFGFDNTLTSGGIPRWQALIHLHAGSIGWITLSAIGIGIWVFTGSRVVSRDYERRVGFLVWTAVLVFAGYIPNFWLAFSRGDDPLVALLPIFGSLAVIVLWISAIFVLRQLPHQEVVTTVHVLVAAALLVAAIGATMGALLGLERVIGEFLPIVDPDRVGVHAGMMDTYLFLLAAAIIEWTIAQDPMRRWTRAGLAQGLAWGVGATLVPLAFLLDLVDQLLPVFGLLLLLGLVLFLGRVAWRALAVGPAAQEASVRWAFFGTAWLIAFLGLFLYAVGSGDFDSLPSWFGAVFVHAGFVGMMTNLILGVLSARTNERRHVLAWGEPAALWTINLGLVLFLGLKIAADVHIGALAMGLGVLLGVGTMLARMGSG